jgi:hypothetical protein
LDEENESCGSSAQENVQPPHKRAKRQLIPKDKGSGKTSRGSFDEENVQPPSKRAKREPRSRRVGG